MSHNVQCPQCGSQYSAEDSQLGTQLQCTNCNGVFTAQAPGMPPPAAAPTDVPPTVTPVPFAYAQPTGGTGKAVAAMVLGIIAIPTCILYGVPSMICGILAVAFGMQAKGAIRRQKMPPSAEGMAKAGVICGWVGISLSIVYWACIILFVSLMATSFP